MSDLDPRIWLSFEGHTPGEHDWIKLYLLALAVLIPTAIFGLLTVFLLTLLVTLIANGRGNFELATLLAWIIVAGYFAWATSALIHPLGAGRYFAEGIGARRATTQEADAYRDATSTLKLEQVQRTPKCLYVLDRHELNAAVVGDAILVNRAVFDDEFLPAVIAHELGHLNSMDARVSCAANRLASLANITAYWRTGTTEAWLSGRKLGCLWGLAMLIVRGCSGGLQTKMMAPAWASWWRLREYAADDYAGQLGQAQELATFLEENALLYDTPIRFLWTSTESHPPTALRVERLREQRERA
ncbi:MAG TPA: M48 family metalloprotease [Solirubrobacteraceae bacterium]|nr:M48 family metalloprotease [Solirubrobacteraceae bacterium]